MAQRPADSADGGGDWEGSVNDFDREIVRRKNFLCKCGSSLTFHHRVNPESQMQETRVCCQMLADTGYHPPFAHDVPTQWCDTREEAQSVWKMVYLLTK